MGAFAVTGLCRRLVATDGEVVRDHSAMAASLDPILDETSPWRELGRRLRITRETAELSQQDVADQLGVSRSAVSEIERGYRKVYAVELGQLAKLYGCSTAVLLGEPLDTHSLIGVDLPADQVDSVVQFARFLLYCH